jgi:hypothetical protein
MQIWKYQIPLGMAGADFRLPIGGQLRHVGIDPLSGNPAVWIEVDPESDRLESRRFRVVGTGYDIPYGVGVELKHVGSAISPAGFVWHIYESMRWQR